jgi:predicted transcriptional regulator
MATQNEIHIPADLLAQVQSVAKSQGRTTDEVAADALKRYLAREWANRLSREGEENRRRLGLETEEQAEEYVNRTIAEYRRESRGR